MFEIKNLILHKNFSKVKEMGYWPLQENAFLNLGYMDSRGVNGSMPLESLHLILQGYFAYALSQFGKLRVKDSVSGRYVFGESSNFLNWTNARCKTIGFYLSHQSDKGLPRTQFPTGYIAVKKKKDDSSGKNGTGIGWSNVSSFTVFE